MYNFCVQPYRMNGLQLMLPGYHFEKMNKISTHDDISGYKEYHDAMEEYINTSECGIIDHNFGVYAIKTIYHLLEDNELEYTIKQIKSHSDC
ncbi:MAG: hypothetical protein EOM50_12740 [Erysipelotrichia bacterium]|nr:hypothetical protein [Erysipelotrichia bacterium]